MSGPVVIVVCPHFAPDTAPTGDVISGVVSHLVSRGARVHVVTSLPWYRSHSVEAGWGGRLMRTERTQWGGITRIHPFPSRDKRSLLRRGAAFVAFSVLAAVRGAFIGGFPRRVDAVLAMSPPLTLGLAGWVISRVRRAPLVFNVQDIFPDAAVRTGAIGNPAVISVARRLERFVYARSRAVVAVGEDMRANIAEKVGESARAKVRVIPNFVDVAKVSPLPRNTAYRRELGIGDEPVVMYAGNVGFSQSLHIVLEAARRIPGVVFVINGDGSAKAEIAREAATIANVRLGDYQSPERVPEVLATGDIHLVPLRTGLGSVSVPSKTYSILAAGRPVVAAIDPGTDVPRMLEASGAGISTPPDDADALVGAVEALLADPAARAEMGEKARAWAVANVSLAAVGEAYLDLISELAGPR